MAVTLRQIAELAGVSRGTVDRVMNNRGHVNEEVEARVRQIAAELGYEPNQAGRALARAKVSVKIGFLIQSVETPTMQTVAEGAEEAAAKLRSRGLDVVIRKLESLGEQQELDAIEALVKEGIKGLAITPSDSPEIYAALDRVVDLGIPVITVNGDAPRSRRMCFVGMDNAQGGRTAAGLVRSMLPAGGKVLTLSAYPNNHGHRARYVSFAEEMAKIAPDIQLLPLQHGACEAIEKMGRKVRVVAYDLTPQNRIDLTENKIEFVIDQNARVQGTQPPQLLYEYLIEGKQPTCPQMYTDILIKTRYNI